MDLHKFLKISLIDAIRELGYHDPEKLTFVHFPDSDDTGFSRGGMSDIFNWWVLNYQIYYPVNFERALELICFSPEHAHVWIKVSELRKGWIGIEFSGEILEFDDDFPILEQLNQNPIEVLPPYLAFGESDLRNGNIRNLVLSASSDSWMETYFQNHPLPIYEEVFSEIDGAFGNFSYVFFPGFSQDVEPDQPGYTEHFIQTMKNGSYRIMNREKVVVSHLMDKSRIIEEFIRLEFNGRIGNIPIAKSSKDSA